MTWSFEIRGLDYTVEADESIYESLTGSGSGERYEPQNSFLEMVETQPVTGSIKYQIRDGRYVIQNWTDERGIGVLKDFSGNTWLYDDEVGVTAYYDGEEFVAAHNPDITDVWKDIMSGKWMMDFHRDEELSETANRLHPTTLQRVKRGL